MKLYIYHTSTYTSANRWAMYIIISYSLHQALRILQLHIFLRTYEEHLIWSNYVRGI